MIKFIINRIFTMVLTLIVIFTITFFLMRSIPGGPFTREKSLPKPILNALNEKYHLDEPVYKQYLIYLKGVFTADYGPSFYKQGVSVNHLINEGFPVSAKIGGIAVLLILIFGIPLGIISALKKNKWQDYLVMIIATLGVTIPGFVLGTIFIYIFSLKLNLVPSFGLNNWKSYIGPVLTIGGYSLAFVSRLTRSSMLEVMQQDYIKTAYAKGLPVHKVIFKHALKNALIPVITYVGPMVAAILTGSFVVEKIFAIPGMGKYFVEGVSNRDYTVIIGITLFYATFLVVMIFIVDILYALIDPRIKLHKD